MKVTLRRLDLVRQSSPAIADEFSSLQAQLNAMPFTQFSPVVGPFTVPATPMGHMEFVINGITYVMPFYLKA